MRGVREELEGEEQERWKENYIWHKSKARAELSDVHLCVRMKMCQWMCVWCKCFGAGECRCTRMSWQTAGDWWGLLRASPQTFLAHSQQRAWSPTFTKCLLWTWRKSGWREPGQNRKSSVQNNKHSCRFSISLISFSLFPKSPIPSFLSFFFSCPRIHFLSLRLFFKARRRREWNAFPTSHRSINIQQSPEVQTGERLRRTAQHRSIMDFPLPFIRFVLWDAMEALLAQNEGCREGRARRRGDGAGYRQGETERPAESPNSVSNKSPHQCLCHLSPAGPCNVCFTLFARQSS